MTRRDHTYRPGADRFSCCICGHGPTLCSMTYDPLTRAEHLAWLDRWAAGDPATVRAAMVLR